MIKGYCYTLNDAVKPPYFREDFFMRNSQTKKLVEISILVALAFVLDYLSSIYSGWFWPFGGSISFSLVPLALIAFRYGWVAGFMGGFAMGLLQLLTGAYILHPVQVLFDYPLPFAALGFAGFFSSKVNNLQGKSRTLYIWLATGIASIARYACHVISGAVFFAPSTGENAWVYSLGYNAPYVLLSYVLSAVVLVILYQRYSEQLVLKSSKKDRESVNQTMKTI